MNFVKSLFYCVKITTCIFISPLKEIKKIVVVYVIQVVRPK